MARYAAAMSNTRTVEPLPRRWPDVDAADETRLHREFLDFLRITAVNKVAGLSRELASATPLPTSPVLSALGVLKHLTAVERYWLCTVGGGSDLPQLWVAGDENAEWRLTGADTVEAVVDAYRAEWENAARSLAGRTGDDHAAITLKGQAYTVRWLYSHVIQETARHVGHLDILREMADGARGE